MSVILALWRWRQSWSKLEVRQGYMVSSSLKQADERQDWREGSVSKVLASQAL